MTNHHHNIIGFNVWIVLLTAILFFTVLAWFNFALAFYGTLVNTPNNDTNICNGCHKCDRPRHVDQTMSTLGFAIVWTIVTIILYYAMEYADVLGHKTENNDDTEHPLVPGEERVSADISDIGIGDYIGVI